MSFWKRAGALTFFLLWSTLVSASPFPLDNNGTSDMVTDRYIVTLQPEIELKPHLDFVNDLHKKHDNKGQFFAGVTRRYNISEFRAYAGHFHTSFIERLWNNGDIEHIEPDTIWKTSMVQQQDPPYGLSLISHRRADVHKPYNYDRSAGKGTYAYVLDSGIDIQHRQFQGRAYWAHNVLRNTSDTDNFGHGTHVAGIIGSSTYGVAKRCTLLAVKVVEGESGSMSDIMDGFDWAAKDVLAFRRKHRSVINISLGGPLSASFNRMVYQAYRMGVTTVVAAGNEDTDTCYSSPASSRGAIVVGATDEFRVRAPFSNWGVDVTVFAPGVNITSTWPGGKDNDDTKQLSGTSMAAPFVSGLALYLQGMRWFWNARTLKRAIVCLATDGVVGDNRSSPNLFAYNNGGSRWGIW